jgi:hypothetical protein
MCLSLTAHGRAYFVIDSIEFGEYDAIHEPLYRE